ncbi:MAG: Hsp70 family protein [Armatimonadetes bacterium]|nr:Hsp70 family protein [Armatimonadota bacterium]
MASYWGLDLGTTNTVVAVCDERGASPEAVALPGLSVPGEHWLGAAAATGAPVPLIPSVVEVLDRRGRRARAGAGAVNAAYPGAPPASLARSFKRRLGSDAGATVARAKWGNVSAALAAEVFLRALREGVRASEHAPRGLWGRWRARLGRWPREVVIPAPVDSFEAYSREVRRLAARAGLPRVRSLEEPVAAALGYSLDLHEEQSLLMVDFGGGTLDLAVVRLGGAAPFAGRARVLATSGQALGGETVDEWICEEVAARLPGMDAAWVREVAGWEVEWAKKQLSLNDAIPVPIRFQGRDLACLTRADLIGLLQRRGLYKELSGGVAEVLRAAARRLGGADGAVPVDHVLLVGGSTLLPGVKECVEEAAGMPSRFWHPFEAVARGAALFATGRKVDPVFYHDYAVRLRISFSGPAEYEYQRLIPARSRYPTPPGDQVVRHYSVLPGKERFALPVCEIGRFGWSELAWERRGDGAEYWQPASPEQRARVRCLNETEPDIPIRPPSREDKARLRVTYKVDEERHLRVEVYDLLRREMIVRDAPVADGLR